MNVTIKTHAQYSFATIENAAPEIVVAYVATDVHRGGDSLAEHVPWLVLSEALRAGCGTLSRDEFLDALNKLGSSISVSNSNRIVTIELRSTAAAFDKTLALLRLMLTKPALSASELKRIKATLKNELNDARENSKMFAELGLRNALFEKTDRRHVPSIDELISTLDGVGKKELTAAMNMLLQGFWHMTFGGSIENAKKFEKALTAIQVKSEAVTIPKQALTKKQPRTVFHDIPSRQNIDFAIGSQLPLSVHDADFPALSMGIAILGKWGGFTGRLMSTVREKEGLTYSIYARTENFYKNETGQWRIFTFFAPEKALQGVTSTMREITSIFTKGVTESELTSFKRILRTQELLSHDSLAGYTGKVHGYHVLGFTPDDIQSLLAKQEALTVTEINTAIKKYLNPKTLTVSAAGPIKTVKKELVAFLQN